MKPSAYRPSALFAAGAGLLALAAAMGIGRFAFTPLLPLMQQRYGITLAQGAALASANYLGYFIGSVACFVLTPEAGRSARRGLLAVAVSTLAMGLTGSFFWWCAFRLLAGVASAFVLMGASTWALAHLARDERPELAGWVFAGVGLGIGCAGLLTLAAATSGLAPAEVWLVLAAAATAAMAVAWRPLTIPAQPQPSQQQPAGARLDRAAWILVACYGAFGFGYIIPATFLPAAARSLVDEPAVFGWTWPLFGLAAAVSTVAVSTLFRAAAPRKVAGWSLFVMSAGVLAPAVRMNLATLALSALCVGGTFMVVTMAGMQEARRMMNDCASRLISGLTGAFAVGQFAGPLLVGTGSSPAQALVVPSFVAAALLVAAACALLSKAAPERAAPGSTGKCDEQPY